MLVFGERQLTGQHARVFRYQTYFDPEHIVEPFLVPRIVHLRQTEPNYRLRLILQDPSNHGDHVP